MISKALVLLTRGPGTASGGDGVDPLVRIGGLSLLQRVLYSLQWAGIQEGAVLCRSPWPEVERNVKEDPKNRVFSWIPLHAAGEDEQTTNLLHRILSDVFLLQPDSWIVDRYVLRNICNMEGPFEKPILFERANRPPVASGSLPPLAIVPGQKVLNLSRVFRAEVLQDALGRHLCDESAPETRNLPAEALLPVASQRDCAEAEKGLFQGLTKPTESFLTRTINRKISRAITRRLLDSKVTPNQISVASILLGVFSALLFLGEQRIAHVLGGMLLVFSSILDGCDGELARLRFQESRWGSWLDFLGDNVVHVSIFLCLGFGLYLRGEGNVYRVLACLAAAANLGAASAVFIRVFLKSRDGVITFATPVRVEEMDRTQGWLRRRVEFVDKLSNRDFFYLILFCAAIGQLWFFMWVGSVGVVFYFLNLVYLYHRMRSTR